MCKRSLVIRIAGFLSAFCPRGGGGGGGGQNDTVWIIGGGKYISVCKTCSKLERSKGTFLLEILILDLYKTQFGGIWDCLCTNIIYHVLCR